MSWLSGIRLPSSYFLAEGMLKSAAVNARLFRSTTALLTEGEEKLRKLLEENLQPSYLNVKDISGL